MRDATGIAFAFMLLFVAVAIFVGTVRFVRGRGQRAPKSDEQARLREKQAQLRRLLEAKTHVALPNGDVVPKCRYCDEQATRQPYKWVRDSGVVDLVRRMFGAPARVRIGRDPWGEPSACEAHDPLAFEEFRLELGEQEVDRAKLESEHETRRARFQREGVHERVMARIEKHQLEIGGSGRRRRKQSEAPAKVVPFVSSARTGTESK